MSAFSVGYDTLLLFHLLGNRIYMTSWNSVYLCAEPIFEVPCL